MGLAGCDRCLSHLAARPRHCRGHLRTEQTHGLTNRQTHTSCECYSSHKVYSHSVSPRNTLDFLALTAGWRSLVALSSPLRHVCRLLRGLSSVHLSGLSAFLRQPLQLHSHMWWSKDGVYHRGRTQQVIKVHIPPWKHAIKPTPTINYTSAVWQLINTISPLSLEQLCYFG